MSHRKNCECGRDHSKDDFWNVTLQSKGMTKIQHRDRIAEICEQLYQVGILIKDKKDTHISKYDGKKEPGFTLNNDFMDKVIEHYKIQANVEYMDKMTGFASTVDFGGLDRNTYVFGIAINDYVNPKSKNCETCRDIVVKRRGDENVSEIFHDHMEKDHPDNFKRQLEIGKYIKEWIIVIRDFMEIDQKQKKEWRSN